MNIELLNPFGQDFPELIEDTLDDGYIISCKFNRTGSHIAAGCSDGRLVIWDYYTRGIAAVLVGHVKPITSQSWSRNCRYILTSSKDWNCIYWDLKTQEKVEVFRFGSPVLSAHLHPRNKPLFVACAYLESPVLVDMSQERGKKIIVLPNDEEGETKSSNGHTTTICFDRKGKSIFTGSSKGVLNIIDTESRKLLHSVRVTSGNAIKNIQFSKQGSDFVVNANDRVIHVYSIDENGLPHHQHRFQDLVNRLQWNQCGFSCNGEYVIGGSAGKAFHNIYIWDKNMGNLVKILEGPKEGLEDLCWHPLRPIMLSVSSLGNIYVWGVNFQENWSAFAPDFKELEENIEYDEREDEFDIVPEDIVTKQKNEDEDIVVDVETVEGLNPYSDPESEQEGESPFYFPVKIEKDQESFSEEELGPPYYVAKGVIKDEKYGAPDKKRQNSEDLMDSDSKDSNSGSDSMTRRKGDLKKRKSQLRKRAKTIESEEITDEEE